MTPDLVLCKAATVRQHLRENLRLIQSPLTSARVSFTYHRRWISPAVLDDVASGATVVLALGNAPYSKVVPVRLARLIDVADQDELIYQFELAIPGRDVHQLRASKAGSAPQRVRTSDGAKAWRCALQKETPSAKRLHWWAVPGGGVELAHVGLHDDERCPE